MEKPYKIVDQNGRKFGVVVSSLEELKMKAREKFGITSATVKVFLDYDNTEIDEESYFRTRTRDTCFLILAENEDCTPTIERAETSNSSLSETRRRKCTDGNGETSNSPVRKIIKLRHNKIHEVALPLVFRFLSLEERNNVRLTCKLWNEICNSDENIYENEKLVFWPTDEVCDIKKCLEKSKRKILNVEFHMNDEQLHLIPEETWKICGHKFRSILWSESPEPEGESSESNEDSDDDEIDYEIRKTIVTNLLWNIIRNCTKLKYFIRTYGYRNCGEILTDNLLYKLTQTNTVGRSLNEISDTFNFSDVELRNKLSVLPNINYLRIKKSYTDVSGLDLSKIPTTIKRLHLGDYLNHYPSNCLNSLDNQIKLNELVFFIKGERCLGESLFPFLIQQTELKTLRLVISRIALKNSGLFSDLENLFDTVEEVESYKTSLIINIVNSCDNLKDLSIVFYDSEETDVRILEPDRLAAERFAERIAKLNSFEAENFDFSKLLPSTSLELSNLRSLRLPENFSICDKLLKNNIFRHLQYLWVSKCNLNMLETISKFQINLRALVVDVLNEGQHPPNKATLTQQVRRMLQVPNISFPKLEHLDVWGGVYTMLLIFNRFHLPSLKHLGVSEYENDSRLLRVFDAVAHKLPQIFDCLPRRTPNLEILQLDIVTDEWITKSSDIKFVIRLPKLQFFAFGSDEIFHNSVPVEEIKKMYQMCPYLRLIVCMNTYYFYNRQSEKVVCRCYAGGYEEKCYTLKKDHCCKLMTNRWNQYINNFSPSK